MHRYLECKHVGAFHPKTVVTRAFKAHQNKFSRPPTLVRPSHFRYILTFVRQYFEYWVMFSALNKSHGVKVGLSHVYGWHNPNNSHCALTGGL